MWLTIWVKQSRMASLCPAADDNDGNVSVSLPGAWLERKNKIMNMTCSCYDKVKKTTLTTMYKIKTTFALMLVSVVLFKIVEMKNHINVNIRNRSKDLELHEHKRASEVVFYVSERKIKILPKRIQCTDVFDVSISTWIYLMDWMHMTSLLSSVLYHSR